MRPARRLRLRPSRCQSRTRAATPLQWRRRIARSPVRFFGGGPSPLPSMLAFLAGALALCSVQSTGAPGGHAKRQVCTKASSVHQARQCHRAGPAGLLRQALAAPAEQRSHGAAPRDRSPSAARRLCFGDDPPQSPTAVAMTAPAAQSTPSAASPSRTASTGDLVCFGVDDLAAAADPPAESAAAPSSTPVAATTCSTGPRPAAWAESTAADLAAPRGGRHAAGRGMVDGGSRGGIDARRRGRGWQPRRRRRACARCRGRSGRCAQHRRFACGRGLAGRGVVLRRAFVAGSRQACQPRGDIPFAHGHNSCVASSNGGGDDSGALTVRCVSGWRSLMCLSSLERPRVACDQKPGHTTCNTVNLTWC